MAVKKLLYKTERGAYYIGKSEQVLTDKDILKKLKGKVQLIITSPPYPLNKKKKYGNFQGEEYRNWLTSLAEVFSELLTDDGSIVIELGNAWEPGRPVQSLLHLESLMGFVKSEKAGLRLIQEFVCYNPSRLPSPVEWVNKERCRVTDSFTHVWWMAKTDRPKADNSKVLRPYSKSMKSLLKKQGYNAGPRPSEHKIGEKSFLTDNRGSIPHNLLEIESLSSDVEYRPPNVFRIANTSSNDFYTKTCRNRGLNPHPARMPIEMVNFFINFLTDEGDLVLEPFGGSNTTGFAAESLNRQWFAVEAMEEYGLQSKIRFEDPKFKEQMKFTFQRRES